MSTRFHALHTRYLYIYFIKQYKKELELVLDVARAHINNPSTSGEKDPAEAAPSPSTATTELLS